MSRIESSHASATAGDPRRRAVTLPLAAIVLFVFLPLVFVDWFAVRKRLPGWVFYQVELVFLSVVEVAYVAAVVVTALALPWLLFRLVSASRRGDPRLALARALLGCISAMLAIGAAEASTAFFQWWSQRHAGSPAGGREAEPGGETTWRLPPPEYRSLPTSFPDPPGDRDIDLVVLGESSAEGVPFRKWFSLGAIVKWQLEGVLPGRTIRLRVLANSGDTLERQHSALARLNRRPDLLIVYGGHNEFFSRLFAFRDVPYYLLDQEPSVWDRIVGRVERSSPFCGMIRESAERCRIALPPPAIARELVDAPVYTPAEYAALLKDFRRQLEEIARYARGVGALPILIVPPGNDADFEPNRSFLPAETPREARESFGRAFLAARRLETIDLAAGMMQYQELLARQPGFAETHYRLARLLERAGSWDAAYEHYVEARDLDGYPMRCPSSFQQVFRDVAAREGCLLIDGQAYFHAIGRHGLLDDGLFQDAMHPSFRGQIALAQAVLSVLAARQAFGWPPDRPLEPIDPATCAAHFGLDRGAWSEIAAWSKGFYSLVGRLRYDMSERSRRIDASIAAAANIEAGVPPAVLGIPNIGIPAPVPLVAVAGQPEQRSAQMALPDGPSASLERAR